MPTFEIACEEVEAHVIEILLHMYSEYEVDWLFPLLEALPPGPRVEDWEPSAEEQT